VWTVPAERMKSGRQHVVPLSERALAILHALPRDDARIFSVARATIGKLLRQHMGRTDITVHGFRSSFRDWAGERTNFPREVAEAALAHIVKDATERSYARGTLLQKRRALMEGWAGYCSSPPVASGKVLALHTS
jgi:integrase